MTLKRSSALRGIDDAFVKAYPGAAAVRSAAASWGVKTAGATLDDVGPATGRVRLYRKSFGDASFDGSGIKLDFVLVDPRVGAVPPFYLSTTEVSVGLFAAIAQQSGAFGDVASLMPRAEELDVAHIPRVWRIAGRQFVPNTLWPWELRVARPSTASPMQSVSPQAALLAARLIGCRLPTPAEWAAAYSAAAGPDRDRNPWAMKGWKLRDTAWQEALALGKPQLDNGIFLPAALTSVDRGVWSAEALAKLGGESAAQLVGRHDPRESHLSERYSPLFREQTDYPRDSGLYDLVGNVAEFVIDAKDSDSAAVGLTAHDVAAFTAGHADRLYVVGGSALSPPTLDVRTPYHASPERAQRGYSDVGFRLAFTAPGFNAADRVRSSVRDVPYLAPPKETAGVAGLSEPRDSTP